MKTKPISIKKLITYGLAILVIIIFYTIINDWEHFKAGFLGKPPF